MGLIVESQKLLQPKDGRFLFKAQAEEGQGVIEYGLLIFLASIIVIAVLVLFGPQTGSIFSVVTSSI